MQWAIGILVAIGIGVATILVPLCTGPDEPFPTPIPQPFSVTIIEPFDGARVQIPVKVRGRTNGPVPERRSLWIVVQVGREWWPQTGPVKPFSVGSNNWESLVPALTEAPDELPEVFFILAVMTTPDVDQQFLNWFESNKLTKSAPGLVAALLRGAEIREGRTVTRR